MAILRRAALTALATLALALLPVLRAVPTRLPRLHESYPSAFTDAECDAILELFTATSPEVDARSVGARRGFLTGPPCTRLLPLCAQSYCLTCTPRLSSAFDAPTGSTPTAR